MATLSNLPAAGVKDDNLRLVLAREEFEFIAERLVRTRREMVEVVLALSAFVAVAGSAAWYLPHGAGDTVLFVAFFTVFPFLGAIRRAARDHSRFKAYARDLGRVLAKYGRDVGELAAAAGCETPWIAREFERR